MTVNLTRIYTRLGDDGETHLGDMSRVPKTHPRIEAYGTVDELNAQLGVALALPDLPERTAGFLRRVQNDLFDVGADISVPHGGDRDPAAAGAGADGVAGAGLRRGQRRARAAEVVRPPRRQPGRRPAPRLPHRLPPRRASRDRLRRRRQPRMRPLPEPPLRPALHPRARGQRGRRAALGARPLPLAAAVEPHPDLVDLARGRAQLPAARVQHRTARRARAGRRTCARRAASSPAARRSAATRRSRRRAARSSAACRGA